MPSVGYRIAASTAGIFAAIALSLAAAALLIAHLSLGRTLDAKIEQAMTRLSAAYRSDGRSAVLAMMVESDHHGLGGLSCAMYDAGGRLVGGSLRLARPAGGWSDVRIPDPIDGHDPARVLAVRTATGDTLVVGGDRRPIELANTIILWLFAVLVVATIMLCAIMAPLLGRYLKDRLQPIAGTADLVIGGDLSPRVQLRGSGDEFDRIAASINAMLDRIADLIAETRRVTVNVAHDLRTPLTRLRGQSELVLARHSDPSPYRDALEAGVDQLDEVLAIFDALPRIAELEREGAGPHCTPIDLSARAEAVHEMMTPAFAEDGRHLSLRADEHVAVCGDASLLTAAAINMLANVLKHTPVGTDAVIDISYRDDAACLSVIDDGPGVAGEAIDRLFDSFRRGERAGHTGGLGIGLNLVAAIARAHAGSVGAENRAPGFAVTICLPARIECAPVMASRSGCCG